MADRYYSHSSCGSHSPSFSSKSMGFSLPSSSSVSSSLQSWSGYFSDLVDNFSSGASSADPSPSPVSLSSRSLSSPSVCTRPNHLPPKTTEEEAQHRKQFMGMIAQHDAKQRSVLSHQQQMEERMAKIRLARETRKRELLRVWAKDNVVATWLELLHCQRLKKNLTVQQKEDQTKIRKLIFQGVPEKYRGQIWSSCLESWSQDTEHARSLFGDYRRRGELVRHGEVSADFRKTSSIHLIEPDLPRTFPQLKLFQPPDGPLAPQLREILEAFACYRSDIGYVQGMSFIGAVFLLFTDAENAFVSMSNLLTRPLVTAFLKLDPEEMKGIIQVLDSLVLSHLPLVHAHFRRVHMSFDMFAVDWFLSLFTKAFKLEVGCRIWDNLFVEGEIFVFKIFLSVLKFLSGEILGTKDMEQCIRAVCGGRVREIDELELFDTVQSLKFDEKLFWSLVEKNGLAIST